MAGLVRVRVCGARLPRAIAAGPRRARALPRKSPQMLYPARTRTAMGPPGTSIPVFITKSHAKASATVSTIPVALAYLGII